MLDYTYEIIEVIPERNQMSVKFTSPDREVITVGTPLPSEGENLDDFLHRYAPIGYWLESERKTFVPEVGATGQFVYADALAKEAELEKQRQIAMQVQNVEPQLSQAQIEELIASLKK